MRSSRRNRTTRLTQLLALALLAGAVAVAAPLAATPSPVAAASAGDIIGPDASVSFGKYVQVLPNGNIVVTDPDYSPRSNPQIGAVHLYNGRTLAKISSLYGTTPGDQIGSGGVVVVGGSNFVVSSPLWSDGTNVHAGAATWINGATGLDGEITPRNSLVGGTADDYVSNQPTIVLSNGNYLVRTDHWYRPGVGQVGAVTWGNGATGINDFVSASNSLVGGTSGDGVGFSPSGKPAVVALTNGNYVVGSEGWDNPVGGIVDAGAVTWGNGTTGITGTVTAANSRVGERTGDATGSGGITPMVNGHYVVSSPSNDSATLVDSGAATWIDGTATSTGPITATNTLLGNIMNSRVGSKFVTPLTNGNFVVGSGGTTNFRTAGAPNITQDVAALVTQDCFEFFGPCREHGVDSVRALSNGNYVAKALFVEQFYFGGSHTAWGDGVAGTAGIMAYRTGEVFDVVTRRRVWCNPLDPDSGLPTCTTGDGVVALTNGNYVVPNKQFLWWGDGTNASEDNSWAWQPGSTHSGFSVTPLAGGDYLARWLRQDFEDLIATQSSNVWYLDGDVPVEGSDHDGIWGDEFTAVFGTNPAGSWGADFALPNGNYVSTFPYSDGDRGVVYLGSGAPSSNPPIALVGNPGDRVGDHAGGPSVVVFPNSTYAVISSYVDVPGPPPAAGEPDVTFTDAGAVTFVGLAGVDGGLDASNSVFGGVDGGGASLTVAKDLLPNGSMVVGRPAERIVTVFAPEPGPTPDYVPLAPARLADTRANGTTVDGLQQRTGIQPAGSTLELVVTNRGGVEPTAGAVALNVTAVGATGTGFLTVYPCGTTQPTTSNVNYRSGVNTPNTATAEIGADGKVCIYTSAAIHLIVDVNGYYPTGSAFTTINPARLLDTRANGVTIDGLQQRTGITLAAGTTEVQITDRATIPADTVAVALNLTAVSPSLAGYMTVYPCGGPPPNASNLNHPASTNIANFAITKLGTGGKICIFTQRASHLLLDIAGYYPPGSTYTPTTPARLYDSRASGLTIDSQQQATGIRAAGSVTEIQIVGRANVPTNATTAILNITATNQSAAGYLTVYPCGIPTPNASNLNHLANTNVAAAAITKIGDAGKICIYTQQPTHLIVDLNGYYTS